MTGGFAALPIEDEGEEEVRWSGVSRILGPRWVQLPVLTVDLLGVQVLWSVEMSQGAPPHSFLQDIGMRVDDCYSLLFPFSLSVLLLFGMEWVGMG